MKHHLAGYAKVPPLAWAGWRLDLPGGPQGGQYHGYLAGLGDSLHREFLWTGIPLKEGENLSDYVFRGPAELRPRPNASGGVNVVSAFQTERTAGFAEAPGSMAGLGKGSVPVNVIYRTPPARTVSMCPSWGCGSPPRHVVLQPPPASTPQPAPVTTTPSSYCDAPGYYIDAAGNCTNDWRNPYSLSLPNTTPASPSDYLPSTGQVSAASCPSGQTDTQGNCCSNGVDASGNCISGFSAWFSESSIIAGVPNGYIAAGAAMLGILLLRGKR